MKRAPGVRPELLLLLAWMVFIASVWAGTFIGLWTWRQPQGCPPNLRDSVGCADDTAMVGAWLYMIAALAAATVATILTWYPVLRWYTRLTHHGGQR